MEGKSCLRCGKKYESFFESSKYCSYKCSGALKSKGLSVCENSRAKKCPTCGKEFAYKYKTQRFCSKICFYDNKSDRLKRTVICTICNKEFETSWGNIKYCSNKCRYEYLRNFSESSTKHKCLHCGKDFKSVSSKAMFCSRNCRNTYKIESRIIKDKGLRQCRVCCQWLPFSSFPKKAKNPDGLTYDCKKCRKEYVDKRKFIPKVFVNSCRSTFKQNLEFRGYTKEEIRKMPTEAIEFGTRSLIIRRIIASIEKKEITNEQINEIVEFAKHTGIAKPSPGNAERPVRQQ